MFGLDLGLELLLLVGPMLFFCRISDASTTQAAECKCYVISLAMSAAYKADLDILYYVQAHLFTAVHYYIAYNHAPCTNKALLPICQKCVSLHRSPAQHFEAH